MLRGMVLAAALATAALAQVQVSFVPDQGAAQAIAVASTEDVGTVAAGVGAKLHFQILNTGATATPIGTVNVEGFGFAVPDPPPLSYNLAPGATLDFHVAFSPAAPGDYRALLTIDAFSALLVGHAIALPSIGDASGAGWHAGDVIAFPRTQVGASVTKTFNITDPYSTSMTVSGLSVSGDGFQGVLPAVPFTLAAGQTQTFQITFAPVVSGTSNGSLVVNGQSFGLSGEAFEPPMPAATLVISSGANASGQQASVTVQLAAAAPGQGSGTLTMDFTPSTAGKPDDPAIRFLDNGRRSANVQIAKGESAAQCGAASECTFQTGTTAGTIHFTLSIGGQISEASVVIPPAVVSFDSSTARVQGSGIDVRLAGFDNTHGISGLSFTFFDGSGKQIPGGVISVDVSGNFRQFFGANAGSSGGLFELDALFPVTGVATQLSAVELTATNEDGNTPTVHIPIGH